MKLTPIPVPGKRRRPGEPPARPRGVSSKRSGSKTSTPTQALVAKASSNKKTRRGNKVSYLEERLPFEVVRSIFLYSENISFVRASPLVGKFLSEIETRREVFVYAFAPTWCAKRDMVGGDSSKIDREANPDFQSALLEFSWANMRFISQCLEQCVRIFPDLMAGRDIFGDLELEPDDEDAKRLVKASETSSAEHHHHGFLMFDFAAFLGKEDGVLDPALLARTITDGNISMVHPQTRIPDDLITGPWDEEALMKFFWLFRAGARYQDDQTWELAYKGIETALKHRDEPGGHAVSALVLLEQTLPWLEWPADKVDEAYQLIYPLELKAAWMERSSVCRVLRNFRGRLGGLIAAQNARAAQGAQAITQDA